MESASSIQRAQLRIETVFRRFFSDPMELAVNYSAYLITLGVSIFVILKVTHWVWDLVKSAW